MGKHPADAPTAQDSVDGNAEFPTPSRTAVPLVPAQQVLPSVRLTQLADQTAADLAKSKNDGGAAAP